MSIFNNIVSNYLETKANSLLKKGKAEEAIAYYDIVLKIQKDFYEAYLGKGIALACLHKYDEAEECYDRVIELSPKDPWIYSNKAIVLLRKKM